jgi:hypothetical protein
VSGALAQQFPSRSSPFIDKTGNITAAWFFTIRALYERTGGSTPSGDVTALQGQITLLGTTKVNLAGGTLTGPLFLAANPTSGLGVATKQYVDTSVATRATPAYADAAVAVEKARALAAEATYLPLAGGTLTGALNGVTYSVAGVKVVGARVTGWGVATGGSPVAFTAGTATLAQTAAAVAQLITDLRTHGLIGT